MAISTATRTSYDKVLRQVYTPKLWQLQNRDRILLQMIGRDTKQYAEGKQINVRLHTAGTGGIGYSSAGALPSAGVQTFDEAVANFKRLYGRFQLDGAVLRGTATGYAAEVRALGFEARGLVEDLADALAYDIWQDATARLGGQLGAHSTPAQGNFSIAKANCGLKRNQIIDISDTSGGGTDVDTGVLITSITTHASDNTKWDVVTDGDNGDGTLNDVNYFAYRQGSRTSGAVDGMSKIVSTTGTYLGINRATAGNEFWHAQSLANGGVNRDISLELMQEMCDAVETNSPGTVKLIVCPHAIWRKVAAILVPDKRYGGDIMKLNGWCEAVSFRGIPVVRDKYALANKMFFLDTDTWKIYQDSEGGFIDEGGRILREVVNYDAFEAAWRRFLQLVCHDPASNGILADISE